ncbi:MAG TPA: hypothetical protein VIO62_09595 [Candidatus Dormibacteraeota bacterium]
MPETASRGPAGAESGVAANERLTSLTGGLLFVLLAAIGVTVLSVRQLLPEHFALGFVLIPPLVLKASTTGYRFVRYYTADPAYRLAGPPQLLMRLIAPIVVVSTFAVFITGLELWLFGLRFGSNWIEWHKLSFTVWLPATGVHVLGHLRRTGEVAAGELSIPARKEALTRRSWVVGSLITGLVLAIATLSYQSPFIFFGDGG